VSYQRLTLKQTKDSIDLVSFATVAIVATIVKMFAGKRFILLLIEGHRYHFLLQKAIAIAAISFI
jgi:hypothetical protein